MRTGTMDLPLHGGKCPRWLFSKMVSLSKEIAELLISEFGTKEFLKRLSDPMFFQALSCVLGFDWHSSGTTTTTCSALKNSLSDFGIVVCGGKGKSKQIKEEISKKCPSPEYFSKLSSLVAKVDSSCIQDGYSLYQHFLFVDERKNWTIIQQGMNDSYARRYHWFNQKTPTENPDSKIIGTPSTEVLNLISSISEDARKLSVDLVNDGVEHLIPYFKGQTTLFNYRMPKRHAILSMDLNKRDIQILKQCYEFQPSNFQELVMFKGMGAKKLRALALISKLVYGSRLDWKDPVKFSFAHGGKDGYPFPVDLSTYSSSIKFMKDKKTYLKLLYSFFKQ